MLVGLVACGALLEVSAGLGGLVTGRGWTDIPAAALPGGMLELPRHIGDPQDAFPSGVRPTLPSPVAWYVALLMTLAAISALAVPLVRWRRAAPAARWARRRDLGMLRSAATRGRIVLGRLEGQSIAAERHQSLLVVAPTQSGKTMSLAVPAILEWDGPVIAVSVKTDLVRDTLTARRRVGQVSVFDPTGSTAVEDTASWSPLSACTDWAGARRVAMWLAEGAAPAKRSLHDGDFWYSAAAKLLAPVLYAAATSKRTIGDVVAWIDTQEERAVVRALERTGCEEALQAMHANLMRDDRQRSSIYTTAETILEAYADPAVLRHARRSDIRAHELLAGGRDALYLCAPAREQRRLRPVFVALLQEVLDAAYELSGRNEAPLDPPLLVVLDEVANIAPLPDLDGLVSTAAGHGIQFVTVLQDLAQAADRWGRERADTLVNNHRARLFGAGLSDAHTLDYVGRLLGDAEYDQRSTTSGEGARHSVTASTAHRPLAPPHVLRESPRDTALLIYGTLPPARIHLRPWYADRHLRRIAISADH